MSPSIRRAQLDQLRHSEKPKSWSEEVGGTSTLVPVDDGSEVAGHPPSAADNVVQLPPGSTLKSLVATTHTWKFVPDQFDGHQSLHPGN